MSKEWNGRFFIPKLPKNECKVFYAKDGTIFSTRTERDYYNKKLNQWKERKEK